MSAHYYSAEPICPSARTEVRVRACGLSLSLVSDRGVFSGRQLDRGTHLLAEEVRPGAGDLVVDLGCGYGALGVIAGQLTSGPLLFLDINRRAAELAAENVRRCGLTGRALVAVCDGLDAVADACADLVLCNPPIRAGRATVLRLLEGAARVLVPTGRLGVVARTSQGAETLARLMGRWFGTVVTVARGGGFRVFVARGPMC